MHTDQNPQLPLTDCLKNYAHKNVVIEHFKVAKIEKVVQSEQKLNKVLENARPHHHVGYKGSLPCKKIIVYS